MKTIIKLIPFLIVILGACQPQAEKELTDLFFNPPETTKPWVYWYWMNGAVSAEGITADLEAMKENGIGGAYLFFIQGPTDPPIYTPAADQLSPQWWEMVNHAFAEAKRIGIKLAIHSCDGFAVAGGPWIRPEKSMQKIVWSELNIPGNQTFHDSLPQPETIENYYKDIAVYAYPSPTEREFHTDTQKPFVTTNVTKEDISFIAESQNEKVFKSKDPCWIQYEFEEAFTCQTIFIKTKGYNLPPHRLIVESSDNGIDFERICRLEPPRHGWQDYEANGSHAIPKTTAKYYRFRYDIEKTEPGSENLESAKWNSSLKVQGIILSGTPKIHQYEGKNGSIWRVSKSSDNIPISESEFIAKDELIDISSAMDSAGVLHWNAPPGNWTILRMGHTSTGHTNYIGGGGKGLECDKFNPETVKFQFEQWFGEIYSRNPEAEDILKIFHVDSWECGSQNWSPVFAAEFEIRRGYDLVPFLPVMAGLPIESAAFSEGVLHDVRYTIAELINENFFGTMKILAHEKGCEFSAESISPVMPGDGLLPFQHVDIPMGEFWLNSPTHDKPNDILDAISGAHIYGKNIVQAEAFTTLRMDWSEHPGTLKALGDRNFAQGINQFAMHVFVHNPWLDRKPGMTLNGVGLYFQRDQTWWKASKEWMTYLHRCQAMLQQGKPVVDIAVFTGEETPRRALTPDRLIDLLPGLFGDEITEREKIRQSNVGVPLHKIPNSVTSTKNTFSLNTWIDPLRGYKYDCINRDALLRLAEVKDGRIVLPGGASYGILVIPGKRKMDPNYQMSVEVAEKIRSLIKAGATVIFNEFPDETPGMHYREENNQKLQTILADLSDGKSHSITYDNENIDLKKFGKGKYMQAPYEATSFEILDLPRDIVFINNDGTQIHNISWTHRKEDSFDIYFLSNQSSKAIEFTASLRAVNKLPEIFDPLSGEIKLAKNWSLESGRTEVPMRLEANGSNFLVLQKQTNKKSENSDKNWLELSSLQSVAGAWTVEFDPSFGGPSNPLEFSQLNNWKESSNDSIKYYSGTAIYTKSFTFENSPNNFESLWLDLGRVENIAEVILNGKSCGVAWTFPYQVDISDAIQQGNNELVIQVTNTWHNRLIGDNAIPEQERFTWTNAPFRLDGNALLSAGLLGPVNILVEN